MKIVHALTFMESGSFSKLNTENLSSDHLTYHLKKLQQEGIITKADDLYYLTDKGKEFASRLDIFNVRLEKQSKIHLVHVCRRFEDGNQFFLLQERKKHPFFGWLGFPSGKLKYGHDIFEEVQRELLEETGLRGKPELKIVKHVRVRVAGSNEVLDDKFFYYFDFVEPQGEFVAETIEGRNIWMTPEQFQAAPNIFENVIPIFDQIETDRILFEEVLEDYKAI